MSLSAATTTRLLPRQTRVINAHAGVRLRVVGGRLWLTQPNAAQDLFLGPGDVVDLLQDWVVIGADAQPDRRSTGGEEAYSEYLVQPLAIPAPAPSRLAPALGQALHWVGRLVSRWLSGRRRVGAR